MYTQCPDCATVFRVTAEALRIAQGDVRCGVCSATFNALENLSEKPFQADVPPEDGVGDDSMTVEELPGAENIELSAPAELALVPDRLPPEPAEAQGTPTEAAAAAEPPAEAPAETPAADAGTDDDEESDLEFHGDASVLDKLFVVESAGPVPFEPPRTEPPPPPMPEPEAPEVEDLEDPEGTDLDRTDEHPILVLDERDLPFDESAAESIVLETPEPPPGPASRPAPAAPPPATSGRIAIPEDMRRQLEAAALREAADLGLESSEEAPSLLERPSTWAAGVAVLAVLLIAQVVHSERAALAQVPVIGPAVRGIYGLFGTAPEASADLSSYELRQWGAASDPGEAGRLVLRASIVNRAEQARPLPLLRLALQDRFGGHLLTRDIGPADYLPAGAQMTRLEPGQRADAVIRIVDPGADAVGFQLDVCLPSAGGVRCAGQVTAAAP